MVERGNRTSLAIIACLSLALPCPLLAQAAQAASQQAAAPSAATRSADARLKEAERLGFRAAVLPAGNLEGKSERGKKDTGRAAPTTGLDLGELDVLAGLVARIAAGSGGVIQRVPSPDREPWGGRGEGDGRAPARLGRG